MTAVLGAASIATSLAQTVYSVNAVGYVNVTVPAGKFALLANPLDQGTNNTIATVLAGVPAGTIVYPYVSGSFASATLRSSGTWTGNGNTALLPPGAGFFVKNAGAADFTITFVGEVMQGSLSLPLTTGYNLLGSQVPQQGKLETDLGFKAGSNDKVFIFDVPSQGYTTYTKRASGTWTGGSGEPVIGVASGFFYYNANAAGTWTRSFSVNQ